LRLIYAPEPVVAVTASGSTGPLGVSDVQNFWLSLVTGTPTGNTPTLAVVVDGFDQYGNSLTPLVTLPAGFSLTTVAGNVFTSFGLNAAGTLFTCAPATIQLRWTVTGTTPSYPNFSLTLLGR
jgi:hypothetical protein